MNTLEALRVYIEDKAKQKAMEIFLKKYNNKNVITPLKEFEKLGLYYFKKAKENVDNLKYEYNNIYNKQIIAVIKKLLK